MMQRTIHLRFGTRVSVYKLGSGWVAKSILRESMLDTTLDKCGGFKTALQAFRHGREICKLVYA